MSTGTTRDRILDALEGILIDEGLSAVTLESVAAAAGVSKGGLLYHFPSKAAMMTGLIRRLADRAEEEFRETEESGEGVVRTFLRTSLPSSKHEAELYWSIIAALRSKESMTDEARDLVRYFFEEWARLLHEELDDPVLAETVRLVGDGLYLSSIAGLAQPDPELLRQVMDRLTAQADRSKRPGRGGNGEEAAGEPTGGTGGTG
ncbi:TetR/AcrR family transcriptional regulator [Nocardiopsis halophila]|uniref:TetR/AcrR family transcriptional regulator n=1 Tax=Nocardiopsis halophila TaxID=141692 RepID=UPI000345A139|nr:TetR/AcrR family transcriptional regulator [Nocardiopsis halophila]